MPRFDAPVQELAFVLDEIAGLAEIAGLPGGEEATPDLVAAVLEEAARFGGEILAPLNPVGDRQGCRLSNGMVTTPAGFPAAYARFVDGGWNGIAFAPDFGGQGLPWAVGTAVQEIWHAANMAFALVPMLTQGAVEALSHHGTAEQKRLYLPKLIRGEWTGTMNLTEPQAGSDVGALRTKAVPVGDGSWRISGQKIFITGGDHDLAENIVHLVLARTPGAPAGVRGISLFLVPKFLVGPDGALGPRNEVACIKLEHKLGINGSPTCTMAFGDGDGALGWMIGAENQGLALMFTMMNNARLAVGLEGIAQAERAYQKARAYARERVQGHDPLTRQPVTILHHPDVRRMLLDAKARTEAARALALYVAGQIDRARTCPDAHRRVELLTPVVKAYGTETGVAVADTAIQVFGGMGYIDETGVAQHLRDARIAPIYEGTNGIQALDLVGRKLLKDGGAAFSALVAEMRALDAPLAAAGAEVAGLRRRLAEAVNAADAAGRHILGGAGADPRLAAAVAWPFLLLVATATCGWLMAKAALAARRRLAAGDQAVPFLEGKIVTARAYAELHLVQAESYLAQVESGSTSVMALSDDQF
ncbi:MAG: acyl-CoA dehydrogenase [Magnetospirillum sp.]|nr:acyl-CoA dehydrogenase [Magnetospirillum sp.]